LTLNTNEIGAYVIASFLQREAPLKVDISEFFCAIEAIHFEANGEKYEGKQVVANIIQNRIDKVKKWDSFCTTIHWKGQFTYKKGTLVQMKNDIDLKSFEETVKIAYKAVQGDLDDITNGADHYFNPAKIKRKQKWMDEKFKVGVVGNHVMQKLIDNNGRWVK